MHRDIRQTNLSLFLTFAALILFGSINHAADPDPKPIRALVITSGCCHDYPFQTKAMQLAAKDRGYSIEWTVVNEGGNGTKRKLGCTRTTNGQMISMS